MKNTVKFLLYLALFSFLIIGKIFSQAIQANELKEAKILQRSMIWSLVPNTARTKNKWVPFYHQSYGAFRKTFSLNQKPVKSVLRIFADTRYILWIDGKYVNRGPCRFNPKSPNYDILNVEKYLHKGKNVIAVLVHHYANGLFEKHGLMNARMIDHAPGLTVKLDTYFNDGTIETIKTDSTWRCSSKTMYLNSPGSYSSVPDRIDARKSPGNWKGLNFDDSHWEGTGIIDGNRWGTLKPRPIPLLKETTIIPKKISFKNFGESNGAILKNYLPLEMTTGDILIVNVGKVVQAYSLLKFNAKSGSKIELHYAMDPKGDEQNNGGRYNSYICRSGEQTYMSGDTWGFKYLIIKVDSGRIKLNDVKVVNRVYPFVRIGNFESNDTTLNKIWNDAVNTVQVCSEDAYVDCADRERAEWMADGYKMGYPVSMVTLAAKTHNGKLVYSDQRLLKNLLRHVGESQIPNGLVQSMVPSNSQPYHINGTLNDYACLWVNALRDYYDHSGDLKFIKKEWKRIIPLMNYFLKRKKKDGLIKAEEFLYSGNPMMYQHCKGATIDAFIHGALVDAAYLGEIIGDYPESKRFRKNADSLYIAYNKNLWDTNKKTYFSSIEKGKATPPTAQAAALALYYNMVPQNKKEDVYSYMIQHFIKENPAPYTYRYILSDLYRRSTFIMDDYILNIIKSKWEDMFSTNTGTVGEYFNNHGSWVHESGASPAYFLNCYVLGVRIEGSFFNKKLIIEPHLGKLTYVKGIVGTDFGAVPVSWKIIKNKLSFHFKIPAGVNTKIGIPRFGNNTTLRYDKKLLVKKGDILKQGVRKNKYYIYFKTAPGVHDGVLFFSPRNLKDSDKLFLSLPPTTLKNNFQFDVSTEIKFNSIYGNKAIHYTLDGTNPTINSPLYQEPIIINKTKMVKAQVFLSKNEKSKMFEHKYKKLKLMKSLNPGNVKPELDYSYYEGHWKKIPDYSELKPVQSGTVKNFSIEGIRHRKEHFGISYKGYVKIISTGIYQLKLKSDDGSKLFIDNKLVADNDGSHGPKLVSGEIILQKGYHKIKLDYFQDTEGIMLKFSLLGPGMKNKAILSKYLFH